MNCPLHHHLNNAASPCNRPSTRLGPVLKTHKAPGNVRRSYPVNFEFAAARNAQLL